MSDALLVLLFFLIALFYSSIGFGGGSSYLALLGFLFVDFQLIRSTALLCNVAVVAGSILLYQKKGLLDWRKFWPFVALSIPAAFIGSQFRLSEKTFFIILGVSLIGSALMLLVKTYTQQQQQKEGYAGAVTYSLAGGIGLLSGLVGIGGGIFLSPVLNLMGWDRPKKIAALASFFILANSLTGLGGLALEGVLVLEFPLLLYLLLAVITGGQLGSRMTISWFKPGLIQRLTACLVLYVGLRLVLQYTTGITI